jgi:hypothetical protein
MVKVKFLSASVIMLPFPKVILAFALALVFIVRAAASTVVCPVNVTLPFVVMFPVKQRHLK